jgi:hypothetical protein
MDRNKFRWMRVALAVPAGLFSLPPLIFGAYFLVCWIRIHTTGVYYVDFAYLLTATVFLVIGLFSASCTAISVTRRSYFGLGFALPVFLGLATMVYIPDGTPHLQRSMLSDSNYMSIINSFLRVWYESHQSFPKDESEFLEALRSGPSAWQNQVQAPPALSQYARRGVRLPYEIVVVQNATGPRMDNLADNPGVIYYCVSADRQQFWATMTGLHADLSRVATLSRVADVPEGKVRLVTAKGMDYPVRR